MVSTISKQTKHPTLVAFGAAIRQRRLELGYSQEAFGDACGIDRSYMGGVERGDRNVTLLNLMKIIEGLGISPSEFFRDLDPGSKAQRKIRRT